MAKDVLINEGSSLKILRNVSRLATKLPNDSEKLWIPEDEVRLIPKTIVQDGTYVASNEIGSPYGYSEVSVNGVGIKTIGQTIGITIDKNGIYEPSSDPRGSYYGYSKVTVNVNTYSGSSHSSSGSGSENPYLTDKATSGTVGKKRNGNDAMVVTDPDTGKIEIVDIPSRIEVVTPPYNPYGVYNDWQEIYMDGMVVKAYTENGDDLGVIPLNELRIIPAYAIYNKETDHAGWRTKNVDGENITYYDSAYLEYTIPGELVPYSGSMGGEGMRDTTEYAYDFDSGFKFFKYHGDGVVIGNARQIYYWSKWMNGLYWVESHDWYNLNYYGGDGGVYAPCFVNINGFGYKTNDFFHDGELLPNYDGDLTLMEVIRIMCGEDFQPVQPGSHQKIQVLWNRPGDNKLLKAIFEILVAPPYNVDDGTV